MMEVEWRWLNGRNKIDFFYKEKIKSKIKFILKNH